MCLKAIYRLLNIICSKLSLINLVICQYFLNILLFQVNPCVVSPRAITLLGEDFKNIATRSQRFLVHLILCLCELQVGVEQHAQSREVGKLWRGGNFCVCICVFKQQQISVSYCASKDQKEDKHHRINRSFQKPNS